MALGGDRQKVHAPVRRVRVALDQAAFLEIVEHGDEAGLVRPGLRGQCGLAACGMGGQGALEVARQVPDIARTRPGAPFGPALDPPAGAPLIDRIVAVLGRPPDWSAGPVRPDSNYVS